MSMSLTSPGALWLLLAVPVVWLALRFARTNFSPRQRWVQAGVRSLLLAALALALARPVISSRATQTSVVFAVDVSHSISSRAIEQAAARIDGLVSELRPAHWRIVAFGLDAAVVEDTAALRFADGQRRDGGASARRRSRSPWRRCGRGAVP